MYWLLRERYKSGFFDKGLILARLDLRDTERSRGVRQGLITGRLRGEKSHDGAGDSRAGSAISHNALHRSTGLGRHGVH